METGLLHYDSRAERWAVIDARGQEIRKLHCGDTLQVRNIADDSAAWKPVRIEITMGDWWYVVDEYGHESDDFELLEVRL